MAGIEDLLRIMARLRDPERGCPWDLDQDFASISPHTIEEAYEVDEAIAHGDLASLRDELGDLLFQVVFQARLGEEKGAFDFAAVVEAVCEKLVRRHPHIFADAPSPGSAASQVASWEAIKAAERAAAGQSDSRAPDPFEGIPRALPALTRSAKLAGRMARLVTEEVQTPTAVAAALREIARVTARVVEAGSPAAPGALAESGLSRAARLDLVGEGIRAWVELARQLGVDPEQALRRKDDEVIAAVRGDVHQGGSSRHR
jgi:nucleoside triphosphate diphosphatase